MSTTDANFERLVAVERPGLVAKARAILGDGDESEDVVQETLVAVWRRLSEGEPPRHLRGYLYRAVELNALKRRARQMPLVSLESVGDLPGPDSGLSEPWEIDPWTLERAVVGLPVGQQTVLRMKYYLGLTFREIGQALSISSNTAASRCRYALNSLRRRLGRESAQEEEAP
jgi:RNA polymerase sigma-70 factor (ECF subfamily)